MRICALKIPSSFRESDLFPVRAILSKDRIERTEKLRNEKDRLRSVFAELLLRYALSEEGITPEGALDIARTEAGKPYLPEHPEIFFNLSHSGDYVSAAVASSAVGIDIEHLRRDPEKVAKRFYAPEENEYLSSLPDDTRASAFLRLWTMKESYVKALGEGLRIPPSDVVFAKPDPEYAVFRGKPDLTRRLLCFSPEEGYEAAVTMSASEAPAGPDDVLYPDAGEVLLKCGFSPNLS